MIKYKLDNGREYSLPQHASELSFRQFIDMRAAEQSFYSDQTFGYTAIPTILAAALGDDLVNELDMYMPEPGGELRSLSPEFLTLESIFDTASVYKHMLAVIESYIPDTADNILEYKGEKYLLHASDILKGHGKVKVSSAIVALELGAHFQGLSESKGDVEGNFAFTLGLLEVATLARREGELIPLNKNERERWLQERGKLLEGMPLSEVLKVRFFFRRILKGYTATLNIRLSGKYRASQSELRRKNEKTGPNRKRSPRKKGSC